MTRPYFVSWSDLQTPPYYWPSRCLHRERRLVTRTVLCRRPHLGRVCYHAESQGPGLSTKQPELPCSSEGAGNYYSHFTDRETEIQRRLSEIQEAPPACHGSRGELKSPVPSQAWEGALVETTACPASPTAPRLTGTPTLWPQSSFCSLLAISSPPLGFTHVVPLPGKPPFRVQLQGEFF